MLERVLIAGSGGQGIILIGRILATVAIKTVEHVTFFPSYGAEVRGGTSNCQVILSSDEIASPVSEEVDSLIIMNEASLERFGSRIREGCIAIVNSSLCTPPEGRGGVLAVPATDMANEMGSLRVANFIMLGAYLARTSELVKPDELERVMREMLKGKPAALVELNVEAFRVGLAQ